MSVQPTISPTPFELAQLRARQFATSFLFNAAFTETLKVLNDMSGESKELLKGFKSSEGDKKEQYKTAITNNIQDRKFLLETMFTQPIEKDV
tara:strand:+ start:3521 stop:3796 length:276 start_codon:yes stop_codon:yes gene_type:complete